MSADSRIVVTGIGALTALADSPQALHRALCAGERGLRPVDYPEAGAMPPLLAGGLDFEPRDYLREGNLRPLDRTARLATAAAGLALEAAGWTPETLDETEVGLVLGTMFGSVHTISGFDRRAQVAGPNYAKPLEFANSVINAAAGQTAIWHNLWGVNATISGGTTSGVQALAYAADLLRTGRARALLAGGAEELCFESFYGFYRAGLLYEPADGDRGPGAPFDARRNGLALGEAAALLVLERAEDAAARGAAVLAEIRGHAGACDPTRGADPRGGVRALARSIAAALGSSQISASEVGCVSTSANGHVRGDRDEARALALALGAAAAELPITAVQASLGETLGASGALQTVALIQALRAGTLPGIAGLERPEEDLPLALAGPENRSIDTRFGLVTALGLEGKSCCLVIDGAPANG